MNDKTINNAVVRTKDLILAINHYITTADTIGDGVVCSDDLEGLMRVVVPVAPQNPEDVRNCKCLEARLTELQNKEQFPVVIEDIGMVGGFYSKVILLHLNDFAALSHALRAKPGPLGWGTTRAYLQDAGVIPKD